LSVAALGRRKCDALVLRSADADSLNSIEPEDGGSGETGKTINASADRIDEGLHF